MKISISNVSYTCHLRYLYGTISLYMPTATPKWSKEFPMSNHVQQSDTGIHHCSPNSIIVDIIDGN